MKQTPTPFEPVLNLINMISTTWLIVTNQSSNWIKVKLLIASNSIAKDS